MIAKSFDERLDRLQWQPSAVPTREIVDGVLGTRPAVNLHGALMSLIGAILGILIGVGLKGMVIPGTPWGPDSGQLGVLVGSFALAGFGLSLPLATLGALWHRRKPWLLPLSAMNLLMIVVILLS